MVDLFTSEEQELFLDVEPVIRTLRKIMHQSGYPDGEPISDDDKTFVLEKILNFHPEKESKLGSGVDFITVMSLVLFWCYATPPGEEPSQPRTQSPSQTQAPSQTETQAQTQSPVQSPSQAQT